MGMPESALGERLSGFAKIQLPIGDKVVVSESGIKTREDVMYLKSLGVDAVLVGEAFIASRDIGAKVREFTTP